MSRSVRQGGWPHNPYRWVASWPFTEEVDAVRNRARAMVLVGGVVLLFALIGQDGGVQAAAAAHGHWRFNQDGGNWSGYVVTGSGFDSVGASWTEPRVRCNSRQEVMAPWVGLDGYGGQSVEQTGVVADCASGTPVYQGWYEMYPSPPVYYHDPVGPGDVMTASVSRDGSSFTLTLTNRTRHWTRTAQASYFGSGVSAEAALESPNGAYPTFSRVNFTGFNVNGQDPANFDPIALDASNGSGFENSTSALVNGSFSVAYLHE